MPYDPSIPSFSVNKENSIKLTIPQTEAYVYDQGYTYNQAGFTYNQVGVTYGGLVDQNWDTMPMVFTTDPITPHAFAITDQYSPFVPPPKNSGMLIGILGLTYP